jgi:hypothetical protein
MPPVARKREIRGAQRDLFAVGNSSVHYFDRALRANILEMHWAMFDNVPGDYYMPRKNWQDLDLIGVDPEVLR